METQNVLEELYNLFQEKMPYNRDDREILRAKKKLEMLVNDTEKESALLDYGIAYEKAGFRYGFVLAVRILSNCMDV